MIDAASDLLAELALKKMRNAARELDYFETARHLAARIAKGPCLFERNQRRKFFGILSTSCETGTSRGRGQVEGVAAHSGKASEAAFTAASTRCATHANFRARARRWLEFEDITKVIQILRSVSVKLRARDEMRDGIHAVVFARKPGVRKRWDKLWRQGSDCSRIEIWVTNDPFSRNEYLNDHTHGVDGNMENSNDTSKDNPKLQKPEKPMSTNYSAARPKQPKPQEYYHRSSRNSLKSAICA